MLGINFGSGHYRLDGWVNVDIDTDARPDVIADLGRPLPFADECADFLHSEDFFDQLDLTAAQGFLGECRRVLKAGGVMRLLTPDLGRFARMYVERDPELLRLWNEFVGVPLHLGTHAEVLNLGMRLGGHTFLYDEETLTRLLAECGFRAERVAHQESRQAALRGLDLRSPRDSLSMYFDCYRQ